MKTQKFLLLLVAIILGSQLSYGADTYQHWISWFQKTGNSVCETQHEVTIAEMADITAALYGGKVSPGKLHQLSSGVIYKIPQPSLYLSYIEKCVKAARPTAQTPQQVVDAILSADRVQWGNDISVFTKNYYYSTVHKKVKYIDNYTGNTGVWVLVIDGTPAIKCDCGNPLERIGEVVVVSTQAQQKTPDTFIPPKKDEWVYQPPQNTREQIIDLNLPKVVVKKDNKLLWIAIGALATSAAIYVATLDRNHGGPAPAPSYPADEGGPAGAPSYPADTGGPNGSPTYGFSSAPNNFSDNNRLSLKMNFDDVNGLTGTKVNFTPKRSYGVGVVFKF